MSFAEELSDTDTMEAYIDLLQAGLSAVGVWFIVISRCFCRFHLACIDYRRASDCR